MKACGRACMPSDPPGLGSPWRCNFFSLTYTFKIEEKKLVQDGIGGEGSLSKLLYLPRGVQFSYKIILEGKVLIHHIFLTPPPPHPHPRHIINDQSLALIYECAPLDIKNFTVSELLFSFALISGVLP